MHCGLSTDRVIGHHECKGLSHFAQITKAGKMCNSNACIYFVSLILFTRVDQCFISKKIKFPENYASQVAYDLRHL